MSNFKYDYILRLLGVCLDNDPQFIILELMEGGDLLSYLRSSRPTPVSLLSACTHIHTHTHTYIRVCVCVCVCVCLYVCVCVCVCAHAKV